MKKISFLMFGVLYIIYFLGLITKNNWITDIVSPTISFLAFCCILFGFVIYENDKVLKTSGLFLAISIFFWFISDVLWGIVTLIFRVNPIYNLTITYCYFAVNLFLMISFVIFGYSEIRKGSKMQVFLDTLIIALCFLVFLWVFVFHQDIEKANALKADTVAMLSMVADVIISAWVSIWFLAIRQKKEPLIIHFIIIGVFLFATTDLIYYYQYFYQSYDPNSLLNCGYALSFIMFGMGGVLKLTAKTIPIRNKKPESGFVKYKKDLVLLILPLILVIFEGAKTPYFFIVVTCIMIYYILTIYTQNNIFRDELLRKEKEYVEELENKVEERTLEIVKLLNTDITTGLYSRRYLEEHLTNLCESLAKKERISVLYIEQNKYKSIVSLYGKKCSESLLKEVARRIHLVSDRENGLLAAYGENAFVLVLRGQYSQDYGLEVANCMIESCSDVYNMENYDIAVTFNVGISCYPLDSKNPEELIKNADSAMLQARSIGVNKAFEYNKKLGDHEYYKNKIEMKLKRVKYDEAFILYYQPQVSCEDGTLIGVEALIRWQKKDGSFIPPYDFIPITEETGMIVPLGYWIMEKAISQLAKWKEVTLKDIRMAINVSVKQLIDREFVVRLERIMENYKVSPDKIEIEITENIQLEENPEMLETLQNIRKLGVSIAVDDFGTGYSSLYYLKNLPVNRIKIAKQLVDNIEQDFYDNTIVRMAIQVAKSRGIKVIAEGVETKEQWNSLKVLECDEIQGYYFAKPMPPEDLEAYIKVI